MIEEQGGQPEEPLLSGSMLRRRSRRKSVIKRPLNKVRIVVGLVFLLALAVGSAYYQYFLTAHYAVALNGQPVVALATREQCDQVILQLKRKYAPDVPQVVVFQEGELAILPLKKSMRVSHVDDAVATLAGRLNARLEGWGIFINRSPVVMLASKADAVKTLEIIQQTAMGSQNGVPTFKERVRLDIYRQTIVPGKRLTPVMLPEQAARELTHPPRTQYATVQRGDSFYAIAMKHRLTVEQIKQLNPTLDPGALQPGDKVRLPDIRSPLTIVLR